MSQGGTVNPSYNRKGMGYGNPPPNVARIPFLSRHPHATFDEAEAGKRHCIAAKFLTLSVYGSVFTIVELLAIIAIIAMLTSLLLPALSKAKEMGKSIKCLSNLKQCGTAFFNYSSEHEEFIPPNHNPNLTNATTWNSALVPTYIHQDVTRCPAWPPAVYQKWWVYGSWSRTYVKFQKLPLLYPGKSASSIIMFIDSICKNSADYSYDLQHWAIVGNYSIHCRHNKTANTIFMDGHARGTKATEIASGEIGGASGVNFTY